MDTICDVKAPSWSGEDVAPMAEFLRGYADYVLRRTTQFGPDFRELLVRERDASQDKILGISYIPIEARSADRAPRFAVR